MAFRRVLQAAVMHVQSAQRDEANAGDVFAAILQQPKSHAAQLLAEQGITRLDILNTSRTASRRRRSPAAPAAPDPAHGRHGAAAATRPATATDPLSAYCMNLTERARQGLLDPLIGRAEELQRTIEVLCRRRKNNPVFVGDAGRRQNGHGRRAGGAAARRRRAGAC